jgi:hypothetical protein
MIDPKTRTGSEAPNLEMIATSAAIPPTATATAKPGCARSAALTSPSGVSNEATEFSEDIRRGTNLFKHNRLLQASFDLKLDLSPCVQALILSNVGGAHGQLPGGEGAHGQGKEQRKEVRGEEGKIKKNDCLQEKSKASPETRAPANPTSFAILFSTAGSSRTLLTASVRRESVS